MKHASDKSGSDIAKNVVEEYFREDELNTYEREQLVSRINEILGS